MNTNANYIRKDIYSIEAVLSKITRKGEPRKVDFDGDLINMDSQRYELFEAKGITCVSCGIEGKFFAKEKDRASYGYHFNLYAVKDGEDVLMTKDHIIPKSKGGKNELSNYQPMCTYCNNEKADKY